MVSVTKNNINCGIKIILIFEIEIQPQTKKKE